ncbi:DUF4870 domain-containing protein [Hungatella hathewayi]|uniref:DUF4870 domain-containing protein n=1 Tax=Hungatella hathewayi TaxID=154046 RepID=UPI0011DCC42A|nr:zinc-ribbon domain-containing protein [Hungatella hathewayi]
MAFCGKCGTKFEDGTKFCPACGAPAFSDIQQAPQQTAPTYTPPVVPGAPGQADIKDAQDNKAMAVLAYIIFLIPLFAAKESKFARYHTNQGLVLFIATVALSIVYSILTTILYAISWRLGLAVGGILWLVFFLPTILAVIGIINAVNGRMKPLPILGGIQILK